MRAHVYRPDTQSAITHPDVNPETTFRELIDVEVDERVFRVGDHTEIDLDVTLVEVFGDSTAHVVSHPCREVAVTASYVGRTTSFAVHPADTVDHVRGEAARALGLDAAASADLALRLPGATQDMVVTNPIGSYVAKGVCAITVDLVHLVRPQG